MIEVNSDGSLDPAEARRTFILALNILGAYLEPHTPQEIFERNMDAAEQVRAILETSPFTRLLCEAFEEIEPPPDEDRDNLEWLTRRQRFMVVVLGLCQAWRVTEDPSLLREAVAPFSNRSDLREKLARIRAEAAEGNES